MEQSVVVFLVFLLSFSFGIKWKVNVGGYKQQDSGEDGCGEDQAAEEQETGGGEANAARHCVASTVWSRSHCSHPGNISSSLSILGMTLNFETKQTDCLNIHLGVTICGFFHCSAHRCYVGFGVS